MLIRVPFNGCVWGQHLKRAAIVISIMQIIFEKTNDWYTNPINVIISHPRIFVFIVFDKLVSIMLTIKYLYSVMHLTNCTSLYDLSLAGIVKRNTDTMEDRCQ